MAHQSLERVEAEALISELNTLLLFSEKTISDRKQSQSVVLQKIGDTRNAFRI